jgi:hypothetical protein
MCHSERRRIRILELFIHDGLGFPEILLPSGRYAAYFDRFVERSLEAGVHLLLDGVLLLQKRGELVLIESLGEIRVLDSQLELKSNLVYGGVEAGS